MPDMKTLKIGNKTYDIRDSRIGNLADLNTTDKDSVVDAINETLTRTGPTDQQVQAAVDDYLDAHPTIGGTFTNEAKNALIALLEKVAYIDGNGQTYLDALTAELFAVTVTSITAVFTQGANVVYTNDSLDTLKQYLVVTANYSDGTSAAVTTYTLSGTLAEGTSTITVEYGGETDTFTVNCTVKGWLYHFTQSLVSSGSKDFNWQGAQNYSTGPDGTGYSYWHKVATEGTSSTDAGAIYANNLTEVPDLSGDFTISYWFKGITEKRGQMLSPFKLASSNPDLPSTGFGDAANIKSGYTVTPATLGKSTEGIRLWYYSGTTMQIRLCNPTLSAGRNYNITGFPSGFSSRSWHHYALTRKNGTLRFFIDGEIVFTVSSLTSPLFFNTQVSIGGYYANAGDTVPSNNSYGNYFDDLYITDWCKWDANFTPSAITY